MKTLLLLFAALAVGNAAPPASAGVQAFRVVIQSRDGVSPIAAGDITYYPYSLDKGCTINSLDLLIDSGTASVDLWVIPNGAGLPTSLNSITGGNAPSINAGQHIVWTNFSTWTTRSVTSHAALAFAVKYVTGSPTQIAVGVQCQ